MKTIKNTSLNFRKGSSWDKVYTEYCQNKIDDITEISARTNLDINKTHFILKTIKKRLLVNSQNLVTETPIESNSNNTKSIEIKVYEENNDIILYIKTCEEFENWLKANKEVRTSENLWAQSTQGKFYQLRIVDTYNDDVNHPIITQGIINFAVLRIPGISQGLKYKLDGLLTQKQLELSVRKLIVAFNTFYKSQIIKQKINIEAEVQIENEN